MSLVLMWKSQFLSCALSGRIANNSAMLPGPSLGEGKTGVNVGMVNTKGVCRAHTGQTFPLLHIGGGAVHNPLFSSPWAMGHRSFGMPNDSKVLCSGGGLCSMPCALPLALSEGRDCQLGVPIDASYPPNAHRPTAERRSIHSPHQMEALQNWTLQELPEKSTSHTLRSAVTCLVCSRTRTLVHRRWERLRKPQVFTHTGPSPSNTTQSKSTRRRPPFLLCTCRPAFTDLVL